MEEKECRIIIKQKCGNGAIASFAQFGIMADAKTWK